MNASHPVHIQHPPSTATYPVPSQRLNQRTIDNIYAGKHRAQNFAQAHPDVRQRLTNAAFRYQQRFQPRVHEHTQWLQPLYQNDHYRYFYSHWFDHHFYGGYWYPVVPCEHIDTYFVYPIVYWLYSDDPAPAYYQDYYGDDYVPTQPVQPFSFARVFYPTDTLRDLAMDVSGMSYQAQSNFRTALVNFTTLLGQQIRDRFASDFEYSDNDVVVTYYENLSNQAIVIEGMVDRDPLHVSFKALLDLQDPSKSMLFVPGTEDVNDTDAAVLDALNQRIVELGGDPGVAAVEPTQDQPDDLVDPGVDPGTPTVTGNGDDQPAPVDPGTVEPGTPVDPGAPVDPGNTGPAPVDPGNTGPAPVDPGTGTPTDPGTGVSGG